MHKIGLVFIMLMLVGVLALAANHTPVSADSLVGTSWSLVAVGPAAHPNPAVSGVATNLTFGIDGKISGSLGCNTFSGSYALQSGKITFSQLMATLMGCDAPRMAQETAAFKVLNGIVSYKRDGSTLTLTASTGDAVLILVQK